MIRRLRHHGCALGVFAVAFFPAMSSAQPIGYIGDAWDAFGIHRWNLATGEFVDTAVGAVAITGLAMSPAGELFGVSLEFTDTAAGLEQRLWLAKVNLETQALELRGPLEPAADFVEEVGLAFDATGRLWLGTPEGRLYQVDPATGAATLRADLEFPVYGLAGCGRTLYGLSDGEGPTEARLLRIDPDAGTAVPLALAGPEVGHHRSGGLDFSPEGRLWGILHIRSAIPAPFLDFIVEFDPSSGAVLWWNQYHELGRSLAIAPPPPVCPGRGVTEVPTLGEWGLVLLAGLLGVGAVWRLRRG